MRRQESVLLLVLLLSSAGLAALANLLGNLAADQIPPYLTMYAPQLFAIAILVEFGVGVILERLQKAEQRPIRQALSFLLIALGSASAAVGGVVSNIVAAILPQVLRSYIAPNVVPLLVTVTILTIAVEVAAYSLSAVLRLTPNNRSAFLSKVRERYTNRLRDTLGEAARIALHLRQNAQAVAQPALARQELGNEQGERAEERLLPFGTPISSVYDAAQEELLILGEPGSGKTTLLAELAVNLVARAVKSKQLKMPVIFSLASWAVKRPPLNEWMAEELAETYQVPPKMAAAWMEAEEIVPLLDGLDEVAREHRATCAQAIEDYHRDHQRVPVVVCCRSKEYSDLATRLHLHTAVVVQPLAPEQVDDYLASGTGLEGLRTVVTADKALRSALTTPLILRVIALAYQGMSPEAIPRIGDIATWRRTLFADYVSRMYHRRRGTSELKASELAGQASHDRAWRSRGGVKRSAYTFERTTHYLSWLAAQMKAHGQTDFYLERMQWDWLSAEDAKTHHRIMLDLIETTRWSWRHLVSGLIEGLLDKGPIEGLRYGLAVAWTPREDKRDRRRPDEGIRRSLRNGLVIGLSSTLVCVLVGGLVAGVPLGLLGAHLFGISGGLISGSVSGLLVALLFSWITRAPLPHFGLSEYREYRALQRRLERAGFVPHDYVAFLDFAAEHILLQRIGGGYRFIHGLLLDYFAELWPEEQWVGILRQLPVGYGVSPLDRSSL